MCSLWHRGEGGKAIGWQHWRQGMLILWFLARVKFFRSQHANVSLLKEFSPGHYIINTIKFYWAGMAELLGPTITENLGITEELHTDTDWWHNSIGLSFLQVYNNINNNNYYFAWCLRLRRWMWNWLISFKPVFQRVVLPPWMPYDRDKVAPGVPE